jgi:hypothetical protein
MLSNPTIDELDKLKEKFGFKLSQNGRKRKMYDFLKHIALFLNKNSYYSDGQ